MVEKSAPNGAHPEGDAPPPTAPLSTLLTRPVSHAARVAAPSPPEGLPTRASPVLAGVTATPIVVPPAQAPTLKPQTAQRKPASRQQVLGRGLAAILGLVALSALAWFVLDPLGTDGVTPIQTFPDQGHTHIAPGQPHPAYNSVPATSGWHREEFPPMHILTAPVDDEVSVHVMEHGNVFVFYDCAVGGCDQLRSQLTAIVQTELDERAGEGVYLAPRPLPGGHKIALGAWTHLQYLDKVKESVIRAFCDTYLGAVKESAQIVNPTP